MTRASKKNFHGDFLGKVLLPKFYSDTHVLFVIQGLYELASYFVVVVVVVKENISRSCDTVSVIATIVLVVCLTLLDRSMNWPGDLCQGHIFCPTTSVHVEKFTRFEKCCN